MYSPHHTEHLLRAYLGIVLVACFRALYAFSWKRNHIRWNETIAAQRAESQPLLPTTASAPLDVGLAVSEKWVCCLAAMGYMVETVFVTQKTIGEYGGPVLYDGRFMMGRGGMFLLGILVITRAIQSDSELTKMKLRADALALVASPFVLHLISTPVADFPTQEVLDFLLAPALGWVCFLVAR